MTDLNHYDYYVARATSSRVRAEQARDPCVAIIHRELASRYDLLVESLSANVSSPLGSVTASSA